MNRFYVTMFFSCIVNYCFSQSTIHNELNDMINISIKKHLSLKNEEIKKKMYSEGYYDQFVFLKSNLPSDFEFNDSIVKKYNVSFFDASKFSRKKLKEGIGGFDFHPIFINRDELLIGISNVGLIKEGNNISLVRCPDGDYMIYKFHYSCEKQEWKLIGIKPSYPRSQDFILVE